MNSPIVAPDRMIIHSNASLAQIGISFQRPFLSEIVKSCDDLKCRSRRICAIGSTVQKAAVVLIITSVFQFSAIVFGSKSGLLTIARILPVDGSITTTAPLLSPSEL